MISSRAARQVLVGLSVAGCLGITSIAQAQLFRPFTDRKAALLEGNWQSCREDDGTYAERVYDGRWAGLAPFELHMGPYNEFALYHGIQEAHREHGSAENLLKPYVVEVRGNAARQSWDVEGLHLDVTLSGGSRDDCESWYVSLRRTDTLSISH